MKFEDGEGNGCVDLTWNETTVLDEVVTDKLGYYRYHAYWVPKHASVEIKACQIDSTLDFTMLRYDNNK